MQRLVPCTSLTVDSVVFPSYLCLAASGPDVDVGMGHTGVALQESSKRDRPTTIISGYRRRN